MQRTELNEQREHELFGQPYSPEEQRIVDFMEEKAHLGKAAVTDKSIAISLGKSENTINHQIESICKKAGVSNREQFLIKTATKRYNNQLAFKDKKKIR